MASNLAGLTGLAGLAGLSSGTGSTGSASSTSGTASQSGGLLSTIQQWLSNAFSSAVSGISGAFASGFLILLGAVLLVIALVNWSGNHD